MSSPVSAPVSRPRVGPVFYKLDSSRVTLREFWFETKLFCWIGLIIKLFRIRIRGSTDDLAVDSLEHFRVDESAVPADASARFGPTLDTLRGLGFGPPLWYQEEDTLQATRNTLAVLLHQSGRAWARVQCRVNYGRVPAKVKFFCTFTSATPGGFVVTGNGKNDMAWPASHDAVRFRTMPAEAVWTQHQERLTAAVQTVSPMELPFAADDYHVSLRDFHLARGVFRPLSDEEYAVMPVAAPAAPAAPPVVTNVAAVKTFEPGELPDDAVAPALRPAAVVAPAAPADLMELAVLDELRKLQTKQTNWLFSVVLLALSGLVFVLNARNGDARQGWEYVGIIVGVLLLHELGHYAAMKAFGYKNLKMFFIPGFGAAVSGRHYNAPAWKKIVVSLMGPMPGVLVGTGLLVAALLTHHDTLYRIGILAVILNAFNLIPVLPLDGGWVAHAALFSRHPKLDIGFRLVTALLLIAAGIYVPGMKLLQYFAIASLVGLPIAGRLAGIVGELRKVPGLGVSPDSQTIPVDTARVILARVRERFTRNLNAKLAAQHVAGVFESLNARPPSVGATLGLLTVHTAGLVLAVVVSVAAIALHARQTLFGGLVRETPQDPVTLADVVVHGGPAPRPRQVVVVRLDSAAAADAALAALAPGRAATRFGQTLLVDFAPDEAAAQRAFFARYDKPGGDAFVAGPAMRANVELTCKWPSTDAGKRDWDELRAYFQHAGARLTPPWASEADWPASQRADAVTARRVIFALEDFTPDRGDPDAVRKQAEAIAAARRSGDTAEVDRLTAAARQRREAAEQARLAKVEQQSGHADLIQAWSALQNPKGFQNYRAKFDHDLAPRLGQWPADKPDDALVIDGSAYDAPLLGTRIGFTPAEPDTGVVAVSRWLFAHGATDVHYRITGFPGGRVPEDDPDEN